MLNSSDKYMKIIDLLARENNEISPAIKNSVCPEDTDAIINKLVQSGVSAKKLTECMAQVFDYPVYDKDKHGRPMLESDNDKWLLANHSPHIFFVANPFNPICPSQVLEKPIADKVTALGVLPIARKKVKKQRQQIKIKSERYINKWIVAAYRQKASDIHIYPLDNESIRISFRIDGRLVTHEDKYMDISSDTSIYQYISNTLLRMCNMEAGVFIKPLDGKMFYEGIEGDNSFEIRLAMRPLIAQSVKTQGFWLRILTNKNSHQFPQLNHLNLHRKTSQLLRDLSFSNQNLILLTGPTGSGKSTTLYSTLINIQKEMPDKSIQTLEDPVEVHISGINQTAIHNEIGMGFAKGLRSLMRSDVDVMLIGEIRDEETAHLAIRASLTGHLVLSTIHCKTSIDVISRLFDFSIGSHLISASLAASFSQRLVRKLCSHCRIFSAYRELKENIGDCLKGILSNSDILPIAGEGCEKCNGGYQGRCVVSEALLVGKELSSYIIAKDYQKIFEYNEYCISLWEDAGQLIKNNVTTFQECLSVLPQFDRQKFLKGWSTDGDVYYKN